jgi:hypothetical protein
MDHAVRACLAALGIQVDRRHGAINQRVDRGNALGWWVATSCDAGAPVHHGTILSPLGIRRLRVAYLIFCASRLPQPVHHPRNPGAGLSQRRSAASASQTTICAVTAHIASYEL